MLGRFRKTVLNFELGTVLIGTDINRWAAVMAGQFGFMGNQVLEILVALLFSLQLLEFQCYL